MRDNPDIVKVNDEYARHEALVKVRRALESASGFAIVAELAGKELEPRLLAEVILAGSTLRGAMNLVRTHLGESLTAPLA